MKKEIEAATTVPVAFARSRNVLLDDPGSLFGQRCGGQTSRTFVTAVRLDLGAGASLRQTVTVELGVPQSTEAGLTVPITWRATGHRRILPTFSGHLETAPDRRGTSLVLRGGYSVPFGAFGRLTDLVLGRRLARGSLAGVLDRVATGLRAEVERSVQSGPPRRESRPWPTGAAQRSELYVA